MGEENCVGERRVAGCGRRCHRNAGQADVAPGVRRPEGQRHQRGPAGDDCQAGLLGDPVAEARGSGLRVGEATGRHDQRGGDKRTRIGPHLEAVLLHGPPDGAPGLDRDPAGPALGRQQLDDPLRPIVAEQPAGLLCVVGDAVLSDQLDEVRGGEPAERRPAEVRVVGQVGAGLDPEVGEVAAAAAGDRNLPCDLRGVVEDEDLPAALPGRAASHQARGAGADDHGVPSGFGRHGGDPNTAPLRASTGASVGARLDFLHGYRGHARGCRSNDRGTGVGLVFSALGRKDKPPALRAVVDLWRKGSHLSPACRLGRGSP